jgi:hypothetical protein
MNKRRAWKTKGHLESERKMDERIKALRDREQALVKTVVVAKAGK